MNKLLFLFTLFFSLFTFHFANSQNVGIGTNTPNASAQLDVTSTNRGLLPPRMTYVQRAAIQNAAAGLIVYCTDCGQGGQLSMYDGANWIAPTYVSNSFAFPVLTTTNVSSITQTNATSGGNITSDGGAAVTVRGVVWSTSANPTVALTSKTTDGIGTGSFTSNISGLSANTTYYVRAYATNSVGTAYGDELSFKTNAVPPPTNTVTDNDGNTYPTVTIGTQVWMRENLRTTRYRDGSTITLVTDNTQWANNNNTGASSPMMCWYDNDKATYTANKMGALYNWYAINPATNGNKNVCPTGWHVPTDAEWTTLINFLDPNAAGGDNNNTAGGKIKSTGTIEQGNGLWYSPNTDATNSSVFSGLPGGARNFNGTFYNIGGYAYWWSSTEAGSNSLAWFRSLRYFNGSVGRGTILTTNGFSVRCLRD